MRWMSCASRCANGTPRAPDAHQAQIGGAIVFLHDFVGQPHQGALDFRLRHELSLLVLVCRTG